MGWNGIEERGTYLLLYINTSRWGPNEGSKSMSWTLNLQLIKSPKAPRLESASEDRVNIEAKSSDYEPILAHLSSARQ